MCVYLNELFHLFIYDRDEIAVDVMGRVLSMIQREERAKK